MRFSRYLFSLLPAGLLIGLLAGGCTPVGALLGAGASAGVAAAEERGFSGTLNDTKIEAAISHLWFQRSLDMFNSLNLTVYEGRALVTGVVSTEEMRYDAIQTAWQAEGVREVINEIRVGDPMSLGARASDAVIANKLRGGLMLDGNVNAINYDVNVIDGTVYLIGIAQDEEELNAALERARHLDGVKKVISYVRVKTAADAP